PIISCHFLLLCPPHLWSTLVPYTTLFRSLEHKLFEKEDRDVFADFLRQGASPNAYTSFTKTAYLFSATKMIEENVRTLLDFVQEDQKSTRLNSSHVSISYAVFCLKKKKKN